MGYGIKISPPGVDVKTADDKDLVFSSELDTQKDAISGVVTQTVSSPSTVVLYTHGLGYVPSFKVYYDNNDGVFRDAIGLSAGFFVGPAYETATAYADDDKLYLRLEASSSTTYNIKYFIFRNIL
jgi:hypothetical protein